MRKHLVVIMCIIMAVCLIPAVAMAEGTEHIYVAQVGEQQFEDFNAAVSYAITNNATEIKLLSDVEVTNELVVGNDSNKFQTIATSITKIDGVKNSEATNAADKYYTITVKNNGKLVWDYYSKTKKNVIIDANIVDATSNGNGLHLKGYSSSYQISINGSVKLGDNETFNYPVFNNSVVGANIGYSKAKFYGAVTAKTISSGSYYGTVSATTVTGGSFYTDEAVNCVKNSMAEGKALICYGTYYSVKDSSTSIGATILRDRETINCYLASAAITGSRAEDIITMVKKYSSSLTLPKDVTLIVPNSLGYTATINPYKASAKIIKNDDGTNTTYLNSEVTEGEASASITKDNNTTYYPSLTSAIKDAVEGDSVLLLKDCSDNVTLKQGITINENGKKYTGKITSALRYCKVSLNDGIWSIVPFTESEAVAKIVVDEDTTQYYPTLGAAISDASGKTVILTKDIELSEITNTKNSYLRMNINTCIPNVINGITIDGSYVDKEDKTKKHVITYTGKESAYFFNQLNNVTIKNVTFRGMKDSLVFYAGGNNKFINVDVHGEFEVSGNTGAYVVFSGNGNSFDGCTNYAVMIGQGGEKDYNAVFVGYIYSTGNTTLTFNNCSNSGKLKCGKASMFVGNPCNCSTLILNVENCRNEIDGSIVSTFVDDLYNMNYYISTDSNCPTIALNGNTLPCKSANLPNVKDDSVVTNSSTVGVYNGPVNTGMSLTVNKNGVYTIIPATGNEISRKAVARYVVGSGLYVGIANGSNRFYVSETINPNGSEKYTSTLKDLKFVDNTFVNGGKTSTLAGNKTFIKDGITYYVVGEGESTGGKPKAASIYYLSAYDADGNLLASVTLSGETEEEPEDKPVRPSIPSTPTDNVTNSGTAGTDNATTNADLSGSTATSNGTTTATVDKTTADKIVDKAVANKSEEIVIDATANSTTAAASTTTAQVGIPTATLEAIAEKTDADVKVKTDVAEVKMDNTAAGAVAEQATGDTVQIIAEKVAEETDKVEFELKVVCSDGKVISDFKGGNVAVTVALPKAMAEKKVVCVYIDDNGHMSKMEGKKNADGTYTFNTGHFSSYAILTEEEADAAIEAQKEAIKNINIKLTSKLVKTKGGKKGIMLTWTTDAADKKLDGIEIYRSTQRYKGYGTKPFYATKNGKTEGYYINTKSLKKGTRYYYKVRGYVLVDGQKVYTDYSTKAWRTVR